MSNFIFSILTIALCDAFVSRISIELFVEENKKQKLEQI